MTIFLDTLKRVEFSRVLRIKAHRKIFCQQPNCERIVLCDFLWQDGKRRFFLDFLLSPKTIIWRKLVEKAQSSRPAQKKIYRKTSTPHLKLTIWLACFSRRLFKSKLKLSARCQKSSETHKNLRITQKNFVFFSQKEQWKKIEFESKLGSWPKNIFCATYAKCI